MKNFFTKAQHYFFAIVLFIVLSIIYMAPGLGGKNIYQHDIQQYKGQSKEIADFRNKTGEETLWTNSMYGGMPSYLISMKKSTKLVILSKLVRLKIPHPFDFIFVYLIGFYIALLCFNVNRWLAIIGAIAYSFSSYLIIIIVAGHIIKVAALGYLPPIIGGMHLAFRGKYYIGTLIMCIFLGLQLLVDHLQITYYTLIIVLFYGFSEFIWAIKEKGLLKFSKAIGILVIGVLLAIGSNMTSILTVNEYSKFSIRGKSELSSDQDNKTTGLDIDYATDWSYGIAESFTLLIPNFMGGASGGDLPTDSETYKFLSKVQGKSQAKKSIKQMPTYWGDVISTSGPVYVGAIICFLFVMGLFIVDKRHRWWLLSATIISLILAWGRNVPNITNFLFHNLPGYNKFRAVSMALVIAGFTMPFLSILALNEIIKGKLSKQEYLRALKYAFGITGGIVLFFILFAKNLYDFEALLDRQYLAQGYKELVDALQLDRAMLLKRDAFRSLIFIVLAATVIYLFIKEKLNSTKMIVVLGILILTDLWTIDKRYLNKEHFISQQRYDVPFSPSKADNYILQDTNLSYRVLNLTVSPFNDASTSYFHKSIGGYHGAKLGRFQEVVESNIQKEIQKIGNALNSKDMIKVELALASNNVLNMLNTKYIIFNTNAMPLINANICGNAWFVADDEIVQNADDEIAALAHLKPKNKAIIDKRFESIINSRSFQKDSLSKIELLNYKPNYLKYKCNSRTEQIAVFSEIYYPKGWEAFINGKPIKHFRANYLLRAMVVPAGEHVIEFKFNPRSYYIGEKISLVSSLILILSLVGIIGWNILKNMKVKKGNT